MIIEYHRPARIEDALKLLARKKPQTVPLGGGTNLSRARTNEEIAVVDLQALGLDKIEQRNSKVIIGSMVNLQGCLDSKLINPAMKKALEYESSINVRNMATIGGVLASASGRSSLLTMLLAMKAKLKVMDMDGEEEVDIQDWLISRRAMENRSLIVSVSTYEKASSFHAISKSPRDIPMISVAGSIDHNDNLRLAMGGEGSIPQVIFDGTVSPNELSAISSTAHSHITNQNSLYNNPSSKILINRVIDEIGLLLLKRGQE
jgi:probable selenate reductase FAD-binding subunit